MSSVFEDSVESFLAPVKKYLDDDSVSEVLVNGPKEIFIERRGLLERTDAEFHDEQSLQACVRNIAQFVGRRIDDENPRLDARLPNGSRVHAVLPLSIRKFSKDSPTFVDLINRGSISKDAARFLDICVYLAKNMIISGGTGSGKTTLLNVIGSRIPGTQRLLIIEDASELKIKTDHCVYFETKAALPNGKGAITIRDLIVSSLRLRPDRIVVGEVRGPEALDLITAMNTGHGGSMGTTHANTPYDGLVRLETLCMMGDTQVPVQAIRRQISSAIHIVVQIKRLHDNMNGLRVCQKSFEDPAAPGTAGRIPAGAQLLDHAAIFENADFVRAMQHHGVHIGRKGISEILKRVGCRRQRG
jgi:pilus assembly protein CpaF